MFDRIIFEWPPVSKTIHKLPDDFQDWHQNTPHPIRWTLLRFGLVLCQDVLEGWVNTTFIVIPMNWQTHGEVRSVTMIQLQIRCKTHFMQESSVNRLPWVPDIPSFQKSLKMYLRRAPESATQMNWKLFDSRPDNWSPPWERINYLSLIYERYQQHGIRHPVTPVVSGSHTSQDPPKPRVHCRTEYHSFTVWESDTHFNDGIWSAM